MAIKDVPLYLLRRRWAPPRHWASRRWAHEGARRPRFARDTAPLAPAVPAFVPMAATFMEAAAPAPATAAAGPMAPASPGSAPSPPAPPAPALPDSAPPASPEYMPSMEWLMAGPAPPMLGEEDDFVLALAPPPPSLFCPIHGHGPCPTRDGTAPPPPSPTPPATPPRIDFNSNQTGGGTSEADRNDDSGLEVINPKARPRLLRCFAAAMAAHRAGPAGGGWNPAVLGLSSSDEGRAPSH